MQHSAWFHSAGCGIPSLIWLQNDSGRNWGRTDLCHDQATGGGSPVILPTPLVPTYPWPACWRSRETKPGVEVEACHGGSHRPEKWEPSRVSGGDIHHTGTRPSACHRCARPRMPWPEYPKDRITHGGQIRKHGQDALSPRQGSQDGDRQASPALVSSPGLFHSPAMSCYREEG